MVSCHRAKPSVSTNFRKQPTTTAQRTVVPSSAPANVPVIRSPAPTPVAAIIKPGAIRRNPRCVRSRVDASVGTGIA